MYRSLQIFTYLKKMPQNGRETSQLQLAKAQTEGGIPMIFCKFVHLFDGGGEKRKTSKLEGGLPIISARGWFCRQLADLD